MAQRLGLDSNSLSNAEEIAAKLLKSWNGLKTNGHIFITLLETAKQKKAIERKLEEIRMQNTTNDQQTNSTEKPFH
jgi:hypothetical protein